MGDVVVRLRLRLRDGRGVDGRARRRARFSTARRSARRGRRRRSRSSRSRGRRRRPSRSASASARRRRRPLAGHGLARALAVPPRGGRVDGVVSLKPARSVDIAAAQLLVRECGLAIELFEDPPFEAAPLDLAHAARASPRRATPRRGLALAGRCAGARGWTMRRRSGSACMPGPASNARRRRCSDRRSRRCLAAQRLPVEQTGTPEDDALEPCTLAAMSPTATRS